MHRLFIVLLAIIAPSICFAWGTEGHQIVGVIASNYLAETAQREVATLLAGDLVRSKNRKRLKLQ